MDKGTVRKCVCGKTLVVKKEGFRVVTCPKCGRRYTQTSLRSPLTPLDMEEKVDQKPVQSTQSSIPTPTRSVQMVEDFLAGASWSELATKYKVSRTRVIMVVGKILAERYRETR